MSLDLSLENAFSEAAKPFEKVLRAWNSDENAPTRNLLNRRPFR